MDEIAKFVSVKIEYVLCSLIVYMIVDMIYKIIKRRKK